MTVDGKTYTYYEATQEQRRREREIRALKREESALKAAGLDAQAKEKRALIRQKTGEYEDFSRDVGIRAKNERLRVCENTMAHGHKIDTPKGYIKYGTIRTDYLEREFGALNTNEIILTNERVEHIKMRHPDDFALFEAYGMEAVHEPDIVVKDIKKR